MSSVVAAESLSYRYPDGTTAVSDVDLTVEAGERVAIVGPNGAGKSTLLSLLGGLLDPDAGSVSYFGGAGAADDLRDRIAVLTQNPAEYLFNATVREDLAYGPRQLGLDGPEIDRRVETVADRLALSHLLASAPDRLSGGQMRRAALAAALTVDPDLLLLDEPVADVDATNRRRIREVLDDRAADGTTLLVSTPNVDLVPVVAERVVLLDREGTVAADGPVESVLTDRERLSACGLEPPQVTRLFDRAGLDDPPVSLSAAVDRLEQHR